MIIAEDTLGGWALLITAVTSAAIGFYRVRQNSRKIVVLTNEQEQQHQRSADSATVSYLAVDATHEIRRKVEGDAISAGVIDQMQKNMTEMATRFIEMSAATTDLNTRHVAELAGVTTKLAEATDAIEAGRIREETMHTALLRCNENEGRLAAEVKQLREAMERRNLS